MKTRKILLILVFLFCIFGLAKVNASTDISKIEVSVPTPVIEQIPADTTKVTVKANGTDTFQILDFKWYKFDAGNNDYEVWTNISEGFEAYEQYKVFVKYKRPNEYLINAETKVLVNGVEINVSDIEEFNPGSSGDADFEYDAVWYEFGIPQVQKEIEKIKVGVPVPIIGQRTADKSKITVKADDAEIVEIYDVRWYAYDSTIEDGEECTGEEFK